ncbi:MAG TPA: hypothetical protein VI603_10610 [Saprospiraceae bacterium]|nr:hypothetical protein [Saprospiraceae bacterium]
MEFKKSLEDTAIRHPRLNDISRAGEIRPFDLALRSVAGYGAGARSLHMTAVRRLRASLSRSFSGAKEAQQTQRNKSEMNGPDMMSKFD